MTLWLLAACGGAPSASEPTVAPAPVAVVTRYHSLLEGKAGASIEPSVSATWIDAGLQVMVSGLRGACAPAPVFELTQVDAAWTLREQAPVAPAADCIGAHTVILEVASEPAELEVRVVRHDGAAFGSASVTRETH